MHAPSRIYLASPTGKPMCLRQGEILTNVVRIKLDLATLGTSKLDVVTFVHPYAMIVTQDCDLEQDFNVRFREPKVSDKLLPSILFCELATAVELRGTTGITSDIWRRISQNKDERYHFLQAVEAGSDAQQSGLPELGIDFKRVFTLPTDELYLRIELGEAKRRSVLQSPYLEHLSERLAHFNSRVALPEDHFSEPGGK